MKDRVIENRRHRIVSRDLVAKFMILAYAPAICWFGYFENTLNLERLYLIALLISFVLTSFSRNQRVHLTPAHTILFVWLFWAGVTAMLAVEPILALSKLFACITRIGAATIILSYIYRLNAYKLLAWSFVISGIGSALLVFLSPNLVTDIGGRLYGTVANANTFGVQITAAICCTLYLLTEVKNSKIMWSVVYGILLFVFVYLVVGSGSRKAAAGVILVFGFFGFQYALAVGRRSIVKALAILILGIVSIVFTVFAVLSSEHGDRFVRLYDGYILGKSERIETSEKNRILMYQLGWQTGLENPVFGIGLDNFRTINAGEFKGAINTYAHSNYIELFVGTGMFGVLIYYSAWIVVLIKASSKQLRKKISVQMSFLLMLIMFIYDFATVSYYSKVTWVIYALILAGVYAVKRPVREKNLAR